MSFHSYHFCEIMISVCVYIRASTDSPQTCERDRAALMAKVHLLWQEERFIPKCSADGRYSPIQCHVTTGYCWCVRADTGRPLPGTSARYGLKQGT